MPFSDLFQEYPNRNPELKAVSKVAYEFGDTIAQEPSAGLSIGLDEHAIKRQKSYVERLQAMVDALHGRPVPDVPYVHPTQFPIKLQPVYAQFKDGAGVVVNEDTELLATYWMTVAVELAASQSAALGGSLITPDYERVSNHISVISQYLDEVTDRDIVDLPETAQPGSELK